METIFKVGDSVKIIGNKCTNQIIDYHYFKIGIIVTIVETTTGFIRVYNGSSFQNILRKDIILVNKKKKLYCSIL